MLSTKLIQLIEDHWEAIVTRVLKQIREDEHLFHIRKLPDSELRLWGQNFLKYLGHWLIESNKEEIAHLYESQGRLRYQEAIPLHECVRALALLKQALLVYIRDAGVAHNIVELYAEEELELSVGRFFDSALYHTVHGYEGELRKAVHLTATHA
ncbi:MAG: hypothetical protein SFV54_00105 [Bryobacteraceae bacterium]|nr:hypothetical protein [Bryobacteraceae bacterium]